MDLYRIPKIESPVRVLLNDGRSIEGLMFTSTSGPHGGPETVLDRLSDATEEFIPLAAGRDRLLVNKAEILLLECSPEAAGVSAEEEGARVVPVRLSLVGGTSLPGRLLVQMPPDRARVIDYLNAAPRFLPVFGDRQVSLVQKRFVVSVLSTEENP